MKSRDKDAQLKNNKQELFEGYAGEKCSRGDILVAANAANMLNDPDKNSIGAQIINGLRNDIKWGCAPEHIQGPVKSAAPAKATTPAKSAAQAKTAIPAKVVTPAIPAKAVTPAKTAAPVKAAIKSNARGIFPFTVHVAPTKAAAAPAKNTATTAKVAAALNNGKVISTKPAPAAKAQANPALLKREKQQTSLHLAKGAPKPAVKAVAPKAVAPKVSSQSTHAFYESRDGGRCSTDGGNVSACGRDVKTGSSSMDRDHGFGSRGWR